MILEQNFSLEHIEDVRGSKKVDKTILERCIYALGLLEALARVGLPFIFKGGTCLILLLDSPMRLSTDIDIIVDPGTDFEKYIEEASKIIPFKAKEEQKRNRAGNIEKRHYKFTYDSPAYGREFYILLDILFEENHYAKITQRQIKSPLLITAEPYINVTMPTADCIMGDKLTAFAPHTTGIPFGIDKELEIIKQMYDVSCLFDVFENYKDVHDSYIATVQSEISYREKDITYRDALLDTIDAAACVAGRGQIGKDYEHYLSGIRAIDNHIFDGKFTAEMAVARACKVMYVAACVLTDSEIKRIDNPEGYFKRPITSEKYKKLSKIKRLTSEGYAYAVEAIELLKDFEE
ncbi:nucleotidyl transferase AbiEii/AbiGii toxin family protein [Oribacterium sp. NK2B42]|uniref:nucleotidyl transferase AbiEii/AbiGii toxin family protein n=1 Tax=Oribacterium sp. NK2B42 TaxID=689781 RepID=UPI000410E4EA|nr:nucleotidyl transferase AbiEii/AbiGii toxin family protein [Oribacterium sp. NK2B42]